jgi:hypothetical protein
MTIKRNNIPEAMINGVPMVRDLRKKVYYLILQAMAGELTA